MPEPLLAILKLLLLALVYLFFARVLRAVWAEMNPRPATTAPPSGRTTAPTVTKPAAPPRPAPAKPMSGGEQLTVLEPADRKGKTFELADEVTVGRAAGCQVLLTGDDTVSQLHARIFKQDGKFFVEDLGSTNGTFLNRKRVGGPVALRRGDRLQVGKTVMEISR